MSLVPARRPTRCCLLPGLARRLAHSRTPRLRQARRSTGRPAVKKLSMASSGPMRPEGWARSTRAGLSRFEIGGSKGFVQPSEWRWATRIDRQSLRARQQAGLEQGLPSFALLELLPALWLASQRRPPMNAVLFAD